MWQKSFCCLILVPLLLLSRTGNSDPDPEEQQPKGLLTLHKTSKSKSSSALSGSSKYLIVGDKREVGRQLSDGLIDPYSVLGFLSFATFIFSIVYNKYRTKGRPMSLNGTMTMTPSDQTTNSPESQLPNFDNNNFETQQNLAYLLSIASKIIAQSAISDPNFKKKPSTFYISTSTTTSSPASSTPSHGQSQNQNQIKSTTPTDLDEKNLLMDMSEYNNSDLETDSE